jgi:hypothetical protein
MSISTTSIEISYAMRKGYLRARVKADEINYRAALDYVRRIAEKCRSENVDLLLLERRIPNLLSDVEMVFIKNHFIEILPCRRAAFVNPLLNVRHDLPSAVFTGCEHGTQYKHFNCLREAEAWLMK